MDELRAIEDFAKVQALADKSDKLDRKRLLGGVVDQHYETIIDALRAAVAAQPEAVGWVKAVQSFADDLELPFLEAKSFLDEVFPQWMADKEAAGFVTLRLDDLIESDSYGVDGSDFHRCRICHAESGAGMLNNGIKHEHDCPLASAPTIQPTQPVQEREDWPGVDVAMLLAHAGKPEEIAGPAVVQHERVGELLRWFVRLTGGNANPKWIREHAYELAYFIATNGMNRHIDLESVRRAAFAEGVNITDSERAMLNRLSPDKFPAKATPAQAGDAGEPSDGERLTFEADPELTPAAFAERLARHMKVASLTAKEVSELTGVSETTLSRLKNHGRMPDAISYAALCNFMGWHPHIRHRLAIRATKGGKL